MILQSTVFHYLSIYKIMPNTALIIIVSYSILRNDIEGAVFGFFAGLLQDIYFSNNVIGIHALLYALIGYYSGKVFKDFYKENYLIPMFLTFICSFIYEFIYYLIWFLFRGKTDISLYLFSIILPRSVYTVVATLPLYSIVYIVNEKLEYRSKDKTKLF
jgi:rod shape-determining protein MreD